ncbi:laminin subunit alpha-1 isoform X2 [Sparus aurata]|uniref:laminin subunit alpha-1 isoform X2 n=1 Tax=Sparus aurata TaxID=8175 RepID=UPI0011C11C09|nr:laminin subunit alpha-1 isoform X2 [Sparus aurata]
MKLLLLLLLIERAAAQQRGLFPAILNLASNAVINTNATCGDPEPEVYCKLVEHVPGRRIKNPHCPKCDANSVLSKERHPITNAIDGTNQWWQSPSIKNGRQFHWITITLDLKQIFQVAYIIIKAANSPRPGNWILERSLDGVTFDPWQFYAISDSECLSHYNVAPRLGPPTYKNDTEVICTSYYSRLNPLEHGEIHTSLINGRPGADDLTSELLNFTSARYIRLRLQRIRTLNADLMTLSAWDPRDIDPIVTRRYYYSIKDISVGGMCICYGHAQSCPLDPVTKKLQCVCEHNTCGESCNDCCPGYHQQPWQPGTISEGNTCEKCNCHKKAFDCFYNQTVADLSLSLNTHGVYQGGGVCIDCQQNTAGINCETCAAGYYRPAEVSPYSDSPCVECNCDLRGSKSSVCSRDDTQPGQCVCQEGFAGRQCDRCAFGFRDFPLCARCECNLSGSINTDPCRPCTCKVNVMGAHCDLCKPGFYNLQKNNPRGCTDCFCFGVSDVCESSVWSTAQVLQTDAWLRPSQSLHTTPVIHGNDLPIPGNTSSGYTHQHVLSWAAPKSFLGNKLVSYGGFLNFSVLYDIPLDNEDHSLPAHSDIIIEGNGRALRLSPPLLLFLSPLAERSVAVEMAGRHFLDVQTGLHVTRDDVLSVLADVTSLRVRVHLNNSADGQIHLSSVSLDFADSGSVSGVQAVGVEMCECPWGYSGTSCEMCLPGFYRVGGVLFGGNCMQCECYDHATECDINGVCLGCNHNTTGPHCDQCLPGFYGDATEGTGDDCRLCPCPLPEPSNSFSPTCVLEPSGQVSCDRCQEGYTGTNCERCASGFYGNPQVLGRTCVRCECHGNVNVSEAGHCDIITGECLRCLGNTAGRQCEVCQPGYYGDAVHAKDCQECGCDERGTVSSVCDVTTGQCSCTENVTGRTCDRCQTGFFGLQSGRGCEVCGCNQSGSLSKSCDEEGRCQCVEGVAGEKCDRCSHGYYGFDADGCTACTCDHTGGNCDPETGVCICPAHTEGDTCDRCETGYWGHDPTTGCKPCSCSTEGSSAPQCNLTNGQCLCREGFSGKSCDLCAPGYHGYPACLACGCDQAGTDEKFCNTTLRVCDCRHTGECVSCDDECTGVLLDDLEKIHNHFLSVNLSSVAMAPYRQLVLLENRTKDVQVMLSENGSVALRLSRVEDELNHVTSDLSTVLQQVTHLSDELEKVGVSTKDSVSQGALLLETISVLQNNIWVLQREAGQLNQTTEEELSSANETLLLEEVESMLETIRGVDLTAAEAAANQEFSLAGSLAHLLQKDFLSSRVAVDNRLRPLSASLTVGMKTLQDTHMQLSDAAKQNAQTHALLEAAHTLLHRYQSVHQNLSVSSFSVDGLIEDSQLLLDNTVSLMEELSNTTSQVEVFSGQLDQWRPLLRKQVDGLVVGLKMTDALENVYRAESHTHMLQSHALSLHSSLSSVCNVSQNGSRLVQLDSDITERVDAAQQVASIAHTSASLTLNMTVHSEQPLSEEGGAKLHISSAVLEESRRIIEAAEDLQLNVSMVTIRLGLVRERVQNFSLLLHQPIKDLHSLSNGSSSPLQQVQLQAAAARSGLQEALQQLHTLTQQLNNSSSVVENTNNTVRETNKLVTHTHTAANEAQRKLEEVEHRTERLMERIKPLSMLGETLSRNLSDIRELIDQARRQAASIKVAVQADRDCVRSYRPQTESSNFNSLSLILKTTSRDNLLFYLGSNTTVDFLAVEMHDGKVSLLWDVGSGRTRLDFPGLDITNNRWTRINATRFGAHGSLSVHQLESETAQLPAVTATSPGQSRVLDIDRNSVIHIGGLGAHTQSHTSLRSSTFQGCLGEASLNERNIGLWNYDSREGECGGCFSSPQAEETSFHFDGSGFSLVQKSLRATSTSIVLLFKTLSPGGLLLYLASNNTRDFLSLELVDGRVRLTFDLGSGALILTSNRKYNTGVWYKITLQRSKRKGYMSIMAADQSSEKEVLEAESPGTASDLNRSDLDPIYIGGLPASRPIRRQVVSRSYVGCIKNVEIARSNFDLLRDAFGVRKGCILEAVRSVSLLAGGFVQIAPRSLGQEAELLFSFTTNNHSGVLLAALSDDRTQRQHFLSVHLVSGGVEAELGEVGGASRRVMVLKPDRASFSDGKTHSVIITINRKSLSVQVDEEHLKSVSLLQGGFSRLSPASFFIGGLPSGEESLLPIRLQEMSRWFRGCIQHLVVGRALIDLSGAVRYEGAELDSCLLEKRVMGAVLPDDQDVEPTHDPAHLPVAQPTHLSALTPGALTCVSEMEPTFLLSTAQFGSSKHSHMTFIINPNTVRRSVSLRLSVRSRAQGGLILLLTDSKQMDFIVLRLMGGRLMMSADLGKGPASITSSVAINDGEWHTVSAEVSRRSLSVKVDGSSPDSVSVKGNQLDVDDRLYLGGLPHTLTARRINVSSSFPGCVRSVSLNGAMLDLSKPASQHDVTSCFTNDQTGSYFNGSGYAILLRDGYKVGSDVSVSLEFRSSQSEGVFLGISSAKVDAIGLEMINGQVVFNVNNGAGRVSVRSMGQLLCDGRWHRLLARKTKHALSLSVDGRSYTTPNPYPQSTSAETNNPVYLGGYPAGVKQNCLSISSRFRGCLRKLQLIKSHLSDALEFSSAHFLLGVTPNSCPVA